MRAVGREEVEGLPVGGGTPGADDALLIDQEGEGQGADAVAPVGHPYVFQSDGEFAAGFLELFLRTPHFFAAQNPTLFEGFVALFGQDPRRARPADFAFYVLENGKAYAPGHVPLSAPGITISDA